MQFLRPLFEWIEKYWHLRQADLAREPVDLEECFTFLELQRRHAETNESQPQFLEAARAEHLLTQVLFTLTSDWEPCLYQSREFLDFGKLILGEQATVESAIEAASPSNLHLLPIGDLEASGGGDHEPTDAEVGYSPHRWNRYAAYGLPFGEVALRLPGNLRFVTGDKYFDHPNNKAAYPLFLKLHGSLGWLRRSGHYVTGVTSDQSESTRLSKTRLQHYRTTSLTSYEIDYATGEVLVPLLITPVLNKPYDRHEIFGALWSRARAELADCKTLVIGGYSFPKTDFHVRWLLREAFCDRGPEKLQIIDPCPAIEKLARSLCNYSGSITRSGSLAEYLTTGAK